MKLLTQIVLVVLLALVLPVYSAPPNIVILFVDDLGYADIGPFGATKQKTPNLDRMAREGMKLTSFYAAPVCSVSRAQLMTGCYGARVSVPGVYAPGSKNGLHPQERTIAEYLKEKGYATQIVGKWHLGDQPEFLPTKQGFDHYLGIPYSNDMQKTAKENGQKVVPLVRDDKVVELLTEEDQSRIEERYTEEAVGFIRANQNRPFFLYFPHTAVHTPIHPGKAFQGKSQNGRFGDWVEEVDWSVGRVLDTLRELKLDENTLVVFTSDNGPWLVKGEDGGSALPLRGGKGSTWEGGVREPSLAWWPGKIAPGSVCDAVAGTIDLLPTCVKLAGGVVPAEPVIDGRDISPLLFGQTKESPREAHYYFGSYNLQAVRQGPWKLALVPQSDPKTKGVTAEDSKVNPRLYNLDGEIDERTNLAEKHPEIVQKLQALAKRMSEEIGGDQPKARRPAGEVENPQLLYPSNETGAGKKKAAAKGKKQPEKELAVLKPGDTLASDAAPQIAGRGFTISCAVETAQPDAVLVAHGGTSAGYALHLRGGHVVFTVRYGGDAFAEVVSPGVVTGSAKISARLAKDRNMTLTLNGEVVATAQAKSLVGRQPQENFCIGHDDARPVASYHAKNRFEGKIEGLKISTE